MDDIAPTSTAGSTATPTAAPTSTPSGKPADAGSAGKRQKAPAGKAKGGSPVQVEAPPHRFVHLHLHSMYSLLDGGNRVTDLVKQVKALGMHAVAVTDHGNLFGAVDFYKRAKAEGVKPILGIEAYVAPDTNGRTSDRTDRTYTGVSDGGFHLVLLAENETGWANLMRLSSDAYLNGFYFKPRMDKGTLAQWSDGLIAINGHLGSSVAYHLVQHLQTGDPAHYDAAKAEALWHQEVFKPGPDGQPRFYLELQRHEEPLQQQLVEHVVRLSKDTGIPLVADNDAHFLRAEDWDAHDTLCCISTGKLKSEDQRMRYPRDLFVKSPDQMVGEFQDDLPEAVANTVRIADRCNVELDFDANHAPVVRPVLGPALAKLAKKNQIDAASLAEKFACEHAPGSGDWLQAVSAEVAVEPYKEEDGGAEASSEAAGVSGGAQEALRQQCDLAMRVLAEAGLVWRYGVDGVTPEIRARLDRELKILADKSISAYFLIVWDFVAEARRRGIPANARGSGVGTMTGYVLGLSNACPVRYGLLFERFTDPDRAEYPDIDVDMCQDGRAEILEFVREKYGHVAQIITFGTLKARAAIRDVGRVHNLPLGEVDKLCKLIPDQLNITLDEAIEKEPDLQAVCDQSPECATVIDTARKLEGMARHAGVHAAGVIVATRPLDQIVPLYRPAGTDQTVTQWDGPTCEQVGLLKMDFLGLRTLSIIERARKLVQGDFTPEQVRGAAQRPGDETSETSEGFDPLDLDRLAYDDPRVLGLFQRGETAGVFQFESGGMRNLLMAMRPDRLEDLIAANALYRPGPMELIPNYNARKHGREAVPDQHAIVRKFTDETYGIMVYQEQVMQIVHELGGIPLRQAYALIKAISKKKVKVIDANRAAFVQGAATQGLGETDALELFDLILKFAGYGFNKSHSTGYAIVAYQTAYLKVLFPLQYMAALLTYESVNSDKVAEYLDACRDLLKPDGKRGVEVKPPDINLSDIAFSVAFGPQEKHTPSSGHIRFGMSAVKGVGEKAVRAVLHERAAGGDFKGLYDFCERVDLRAVNRSTIEALIKCGAFDELHGVDQRAALCHALDAAVRAGQRAASDRATGQNALFGMPDPAASTTKDEGPGEPELPSVDAWPTSERLAYEREVLGLFVSSHPLDEHRETIARFATATLEDAKQLPAGVEVVVGGMLARVKPAVTRTGRSAGQKMAMITLEDATSRMDGVCFSDTYAQHFADLEPDRVVFLGAKIDRRREEPALVVQRVIAVDEAARWLTAAVRIVLDPPTGEGEPDPGPLKAVRNALQRVATQSRDGAQAPVWFEIHQADQVVRLRSGAKVTASPQLVESINTLLSPGKGCTGRCELHGARRVDVARHAGAGLREQPKLERYAMHDDGGASMARLDN
ncbi:MAG: DNA polymerase III subunit alpha [Planctomycetota bacterium]